MDTRVLRKQNSSEETEENIQKAQNGPLTSPEVINSPPFIVPAALLNLPSPEALTKALLPSFSSVTNKLVLPVIAPKSEPVPDTKPSQSVSNSVFEIRDPRLRKKMLANAAAAPTLAPFLLSPPPNVNVPAPVLLSPPPNVNVPGPVLLSPPPIVNVQRPVTQTGDVPRPPLILGQPPFRDIPRLPPQVSALSGPFPGPFPSGMTLTRPPSGPVPQFFSNRQPFHPRGQTIVPSPTNGPRSCLPPSENIKLPNTNVPPPNFRPQVPPPYFPPGPRYPKVPLQAPPFGPKGLPPVRGPPPPQSNKRGPSYPYEQSEIQYPQDKGSRDFYNGHYQKEGPYMEGSVPTESLESSLCSSQDRRPRSRSSDRCQSEKRRSRSREREHSVRSENGKRGRQSPRYPPERSRTRDRRRSRSLERPRRSRSRDRRRSRSRDRQRRSRSRDRQRRSRSRDRQRRSRSRDRQRRSRSRESWRSRSKDRRPRSRDRNRRSRSLQRRRSHSRDRPRAERSRNGRRSRSSDRQRARSYRSESRVSHSSQKSSEVRSPGRSREEDRPGGDMRREELIEKWRRLNCKDDEELEKRLLEISKMNSDQLLEEQSNYWIRSAPATIYYERDNANVGLMRATPRLVQLCKEFDSRLIQRAKEIRSAQRSNLPPPPVRSHNRRCQHHSYNSCSSNSDDEEEVGSEESQIMEELQRKMQHPYRLHRELWYNEPGEMNDGPLCKCSIKARRSGIRHGIYAGEPPPEPSHANQTNHSLHTQGKDKNTTEEVLAVKTEETSNSNEAEAVIDESVSQNVTDSAQKTSPVENGGDPVADDVESDVVVVTHSRCDPYTNNAGKLYHYRITISPPTNFLSKTPTIIQHDGHEFIFAGFSLFSHYPLPKLPDCKVIRFNIEYIILYAEESFPENITIRECDLFFEYLFGEILELVDLDLFAKPGKCPVFHFMPRFVRELEQEGHELLPMCLVLKYLISSYKPLVPKELLPDIPKTSASLWQDFANAVKGMIVTLPGMKPSSIRVDQLDKDVAGGKKNENDSENKEKESLDTNGDPDKETAQELALNIKQEDSSAEIPENPVVKTEMMATDQSAGVAVPENEPETGGEESMVSEKDAEIPYPEIIHFGIRPPQLSYAGNQDYQKAWREYIKLRHLIANLAKPSRDDKQKLAAKEVELQKMRTKSNMKRDVTAIVSSEGFYRTGLMCDVVQHAMLIPVLACHLRFHRSLNVLEERIGYVFKNRSLLQLALTHPSYRENFGTNPDHARNSLTNCGIRQLEYGDRRIHYMSTKKRGINTLMSIMSRFGSQSEEESNIYHNERLEFLGDAVVEFVSTIHLFHIFRDLEEGGLATYRAALVQNQHLAVLAKVLSLDAFLLYAHGSDLCHDLELDHALANCFEALMGALFLDGAIHVADRVFGETVLAENADILEVWEKYPPHLLQDQEPDGDRRWIEKVEFLKNLAKFEDSIGVEFTHIRLLARAFTDRSVGYTNLTLGSNQRLEFLGDSVLQLVASEYLYKHFPDHHEGHLSLLRSSLVNNNTQSVVCDDLGMTDYARYAPTKGDLKVKDKADLLEAFLGSLYIDKGSLYFVEQFCKVCFFPRLQDFIMNQEWNDPKSKLQQCCLTLRTMDGGEPDIPCYKVVECKGPTNTRTYSVAVYFQRKRLATASGHSIQQAEMNAAQAAMQTCGNLFPQLDHQKRVIAKHIKTKPRVKNSKSEVCETRPRRCETPERYKIRRTSSRDRRRRKSTSSSPRNNGSPGKRSSRSSSKSDSVKSFTIRKRSSSKSASLSPPRRKARSSSRSDSRSPVKSPQREGRNQSPPCPASPDLSRDGRNASPPALESPSVDRNELESNREISPCYQSKNVAPPFRQETSKSFNQTPKPDDNPFGDDFM